MKLNKYVNINNIDNYYVIFTIIYIEKKPNSNENGKTNWPY